MADFKTLCVYCGSGEGKNPSYLKAAQRLGKDMAEHKIRLIYGGGSIGLMGAVARSVLDHNGKITGIIPEFLKNREIMLKRAHELIVTEDMHERKRTMFDRAEAFVALPGGIGTLEELVEMLTWAQLGRHEKPVIVANIDGFWDPLLSLLDYMREESFIREELKVDFLVANKIEDVIPMLQKDLDHRRQEAVDIKADEHPIVKDL